MADLNIDGLIQSGDGGINGGRFFPPSSTNLIRVNRNNNNSTHNIYSSQQDLSKLSNSNNHSNFQRSRIYGSQQSLSTVSNRNNTVTNSKSAQHGFNDISNNSQNSFSNANSTNATADVWLNAWNVPSIPVVAPSINAAAASTKRPTPATHTNTQNLGFHNSRNSHINDPWTGDFTFWFILFLV